MNIIIMLVALKIVAGFNTLTIIDTSKTMEECQGNRAAIIKKYPEAKNTLMCLPVVQEGYHDPI